MITVLGRGGPDRASPKIKRVGANMQAGDEPKYKTQLLSPLIDASLAGGQHSSFEF